ncbi:ABC transporter permease [Streptomyces blattellae]|uniref:ABC transporter permease n=1 Tax=Streptomyces blattellae TaxID=2569855 RepID=UPI001E3903CA|nr:ABC transporter permease [Streptomyces blattellae]
MLRSLGARLLRLVPVLFLVSLGTFFLVDLVPGDPAVAILGSNATPEQYEAVRAELGLNESVVTRYFDWLGDTLRGDLGESLTPPTQSVTDLIQSRLPVTIQIATMAMLISVTVSIVLALAAAYRPGKVFDRVTSGTAFAAIAVPQFLTGLLLIFFVLFHTDLVRWFVLVAGIAGAVLIAVRAVGGVTDHPPGNERVRAAAIRAVLALAVVGFAVLLFARFPEFPRQGFTRISEDGLWPSLRDAFLPALTLAVAEIAIFMRLLRNDLITTLQEDYILSARAKGMPPWRILVRDALRPSSFSLITVAGVALGRLMGGTVIVETIFNLPGMGTLIVNAIGAQDVRVIQSSVLVIAVFYVLVNLLVDLSYSQLDPRLRRGRV